MQQNKTQGENSIQPDPMTFTLKKQGYDPLIDYLKGLCIICVVINHCTPVEVMRYSAFFFWAGPAVPVFLLIQVFHTYKKGFDGLQIKWKKLWSRIFRPYLICELTILAYFFIKSSDYNLSGIADLLVHWVKSGGYGPGSQYPWLYLQFAILLPILAPVFRTPKAKPLQWLSNKAVLCVTFIVVSQAIETASACFGLSQLIYRMTILRHFFLFYLGYLLATEGFKLNAFTFTAAAICLAFTAYTQYSDTDFTPLFYPFVHTSRHWFCYVFIAWMVLFIYRFLYNHTPKEGKTMKFILLAGKYSYEIFMFQMAYFVIVNPYIFDFLEAHFSSFAMLATLKTFIPLLLCTVPVLFYKSLRS